MNTDDVVTLTQAIVDNAQRLGFTWGLRLATVTSVNADGTVRVMFDGDTVSINAISMIGTLTVRNRVYVISVPPAGQFITAMVAGTTYRVRQTLTAPASSVVFLVPSALRQVRLNCLARSDAAVQAMQLVYRLNTDNSALYFSELVQGQNATTVAAAISGGTSGLCGILTGSLAGAGVFGSSDITFTGWDLSSVTSFVGVTYTSQALGNGVANFFTLSGGGIYAGASPYTSITLLPTSGNFIAGSDFQLEGIPS